MNKLFYIFLFLIAFLPDATGQNWNLFLQNDDFDEKIKGLHYETSFKDSLSAIREISYYIVKLHEASYLEAAADSILFKGQDSVLAYIHVGPKHHWSRLQSGNVPDEYLYKSGYKQKFYSQTRFSYRELAGLENSIIKYSENNGYPFAVIGLDSIKITESYFQATLNYQSGPLIQFDTIAIVGSAKVKRKYLESYLGIRPGALYNQQKVISLERQLKQIQYLKVVKSPEVFFSMGKAQPVLFLTNRKCNQLDGYIGFQPGSKSNGKLLITGEFNMSLKNLLQTGKELNIQWKRFDIQSQLLNTSYLHPRLFRSNIDVKLNFNLLKQDTSFLILDRKASVFYTVSPGSQIKFFAGLKSNASLGTTANTNVEGNNHDFKFVNYGLGYVFNSLDDVFYPMTGWNLSIDVATGNKRIVNYTPTSTEISIPLNSIQWNADISIMKFFRIGKKATLLNQLQGGIVNSQNLVLSDLYRIGGLKTLRGFNENNYYASDYAIYTLEYRYFTDESSYVMLFLNQAYFDNQLNNNYTDWPLGFGTGISFTTKAGVFQFIYALGQAKDQPINLNLSKIHFGLVSRF